MKWSQKQPSYGDIIRTKVSFYYHYGIFVSPDRVIQFGLPNDPGRPSSEIKVLATDVYTFLNGGSIEVGICENSEKSTRCTPSQTVEIAESKLGEGGYDILHNNCEHFVYFCAFKEAKSSFLQNIRSKLRQKLENQK